MKSEPWGTTQATAEGRREKTEKGRLEKMQARNNKEERPIKGDKYKIQLTLEQQEFGLHGSIRTRIAFNKHLYCC